MEREAAAYLRLSVRSLKAITGVVIVYEQYGRTRVFRRDVLDAYLRLPDFGDGGISAGRRVSLIDAPARMTPEPSEDDCGDEYV